MARDADDAALWADEYQKALEEVADRDFTPEETVSEYEMGYEQGMRDASPGRLVSEYEMGYEDGLRDAMNRHERAGNERSENAPRRDRRAGYDTDARTSRRNRRPEYDSEDGSPRKNRPSKRKKKSSFPIVVSVILLIIIIPLLWLMKQLQGVHVGGFDASGIREMISEQVRRSSESGMMSGYRNIALFGVDSTEGTLDAGNNRSDIMVIASIDNKTGDIKLVSLYRDTYLDIGNGNYQKANAAYAYGGPEQAVRMLNTNLDLDITDYATVGFEGIARIIDAVGGIEIDVQEDEIEHLNNYQLTMSEETGLPNIPVTQTGPQTLTGLQATAYCRIRYTEGNDFRRTERQREVLTKTFAKIKKNPLGIIRNMDSIMECVRTSLSVAELGSLAVQAVQFNIVDNGGLPIEEMRTVGYIGDQSCVIPITLASNVAWLHQYLFAETDYVPSDTVQQISAQISAVSGY